MLRFVTRTLHVARLSRRERIGGDHVSEEAPALGIKDEDLAKLLRALAEAERAQQETVTRFVQPRPGILEEVSARRHQLVTGRRGVGKSTLLHRVAAEGESSNHAVIFIDIETLRRRPYPDVLIELLKELFDHLDERLAFGERSVARRRRRLRTRLRELSNAMSELLSAPQAAEHTLSTLRSQVRKSESGWSLRGSGRFGVKRAGQGVDAEAAAAIKRGASEQQSSQAAVEARFVKTKMDGLAEAVIIVREVLGDAQRELGVPTLVVLDDFYHVALDDQPEVLAYLHQVVKGLDITLKICGVPHRLNPYAGGDPPVGMEPGDDLATIPLDITLEQFEMAKQFLERVLEGICAPLGITLDVLLTEGGRERLVLASGGVARDYITLVRRALRHATERPSHQWRVKNRITAEDVAQAAAELYEQKQDDLKRDSGEAAEELRSLLGEIVRFCLEENRTNVFLVETTKLQEEPWGTEIQALADLRFLHRVATLSTKRGGEGYAGRKFAAFTLDVSTWTSTRSERISPISFWESEGRQKIREPRLIYTPERARSKVTPALTTAAAGDGDAEASVLLPGEQLTFEFDDR
jgi:Cdc6-like AAA superfamily ATPase